MNPKKSGKDESSGKSSAKSSAKAGSSDKEGTNPGNSSDEVQVVVLFRQIKSDESESGISQESTSKWFETAGLFDKKDGISKDEWEEAFKKALKGKEFLNLESLTELIETFAKEKKKNPSKWFRKLLKHPNQK